MIVFMDGNRVHDTAWTNAEKRDGGATTKKSLEEPPKVERDRDWIG